MINTKTSRFSVNTDLYYICAANKVTCVVTHNKERLTMYYFSAGKYNVRLSMLMTFGNGQRQRLINISWQPVPQLRSRNSNDWFAKYGAQALDNRKATSELSLVSETQFKGQMYLSTYRKDRSVAVFSKGTNFNQFFSMSNYLYKCILVDCWVQDQKPT